MVAGKAEGPKTRPGWFCYGGCRLGELNAGVETRPGWPYCGGFGIEVTGGMPVPLCLLREAGSDDDAEGLVRRDDATDDGVGEGVVAVAEREEGVEVVRVDGEEEAAGSLGVGGDEAEGVGGGGEVGPWGGELGIGFRATGEAA